MVFIWRVMGLMSQQLLLGCIECNIFSLWHKPCEGVLFHLLRERGLGKILLVKPNWSILMGVSFVSNLLLCAFILVYYIVSGQSLLFSCCVDNRVKHAQVNNSTDKFLKITSGIVQPLECIYIQEYSLRGTRFIFVNSSDYTYIESTIMYNCSYMLKNGHYIFT